MLSNIKYIQRHIVAHTNTCLRVYLCVFWYVCACMIFFFFFSRKSVCNHASQRIDRCRKFLQYTGYNNINLMGRTDVQCTRPFVFSSRRRALLIYTEPKCWLYRFLRSCTYTRYFLKFILFSIGKQHYYYFRICCCDFIHISNANNQLAD